MIFLCCQPGSSSLGRVKTSAKRTKHKWMRWTTRGLETIINIILVRYCSEKNYEEFKNKIMKSENLMFIMAEIKISSIRG